MQKLYLKIKDHWAFVVGLVFFTWIATKPLDYLYSALQAHKGKIFYPIFKLLAFEVTLYISSLLVGFVVVYIIYKIVQLFKITRHGLRILNATYGSDEKFINITNELNKAVDVEGNTLKIVLSNNIAGDPHRRVRKKGKIEYIYNGNKFEHEYKEGDLVELPDDSSSRVDKELLWQNRPRVKIVGFVAMLLSIIGLGWAIWAYFNPYNSGNSGGARSFTEPELGISNIFIDYFDENMLKIDGLDINSEVELDKISSLLIYFELKNIGDLTLVFTANKISIKTSSGDLSYDHVLEDFESKVMIRDSRLTLHYIKAIKASFILNQLEQGDKFTITIEPNIVYFRKDKLDEPKIFDSIIQCNNILNKEFLPKFKPACHIVYLGD